MKKKSVLCISVLWALSVSGKAFIHPAQPPSAVKAFVKAEKNDMSSDTASKQLSNKEVAFLAGTTLFHFLNGCREGIEETLHNQGSRTTNWMAYLYRKLFLIGTPCLLQKGAAYLYEIPQKTAKDSLKITVPAYIIGTWLGNSITALTLATQAFVIPPVIVQQQG